MCNEGCEHLPSKFSEGTELGGGVGTPERSAALQRGLGRLERWPERDHLKFHKWKCRVLHTGKNTQYRNQHRLGNKLLGSSSMEKDLVDKRLLLNLRRGG